MNNGHDGTLTLITPKLDIYSFTDLCSVRGLHKGRKVEKLLLNCMPPAFILCIDQVHQDVSCLNHALNLKKEKDKSALESLFMHLG
jgi:hypothetical protein